jgi:hypothetical protein
MAHDCQFLCSELVTVMYEECPGELQQMVANLEEISVSSAIVLLEERPRLGSPIALEIKGRDLYGVITSSVYDRTLGWFVTITLDPGSSWHKDSMAPKHLLDVCGCSLKGMSRSKA